MGDTGREFPVASVTKLVAAYGVMLAVEEGAVELAQPAGPEGSTLEHLLAHASGISFDSREPQKPVGERRIYSSAGYEWAADTVAKATGMDFAEYLREGIDYYADPDAAGIIDRLRVNGPGGDASSIINRIIREWATVIPE